jgi:hypothetical protein
MAAGYPLKTFFDMFRQAYTEHWPFRSPGRKMLKVAGKKKPDEFIRLDALRR